jgi:hypothetical protein
VIDNVNLLELPRWRGGRIPVSTVSCAEDLCGLIAPVSPCSGLSGCCPALRALRGCGAQHSRPADVRPASTSTVTTRPEGRLVARGPRGSTA